VAVLDVRTDREFNSGRVAGARHVPHDGMLDNLNIKEGMAKEIISGYCSCGVKQIVVVCMYSQCSSPLIANTLAAVAKTSRQPVEILVLDGGFHSFLNKIHKMYGDAMNNVPGLIEGVQRNMWRRTSTRGFVEADTVDCVEQLTPSGSSAQSVKSLLKAHEGKLSLEDLEDLCKRASPNLALSKDELRTLFMTAPNNKAGFVDWHEFVDYIYTDNGAGSQDGNQGY